MLRAGVADAVAVMTLRKKEDRERQTDVPARLTVSIGTHPHPSRAISSQKATGLGGNGPFRSSRLIVAIVQLKCRFIQYCIQL